jgi:hypothetical protein
MADEKSSKDGDKDSRSPHAGIAFLGRLADATRISPLRPGTLAREGGGVMSEWVCRFTAADCSEATINPAISLPKELRYHTLASGSQDRKETTLTSASEFTNKFAGSVSVEGSAFGATCKASLDYKNFLEVTRSGERAMTYAQAVREDDEVELEEDFLKAWDIRPTLLEAVKALPDAKTLSAEDKAHCWRFIRQFGTHYIYSAVFGGRVFRQTVKTASAQSTGKSEERGAGASVGYSGPVGSGKVEGKVEDAHGSKNSQAQSVFNSTSAWYGGKPKSTFNDWVQTVESDPQPLTLRLRRLSQLFDQRGFKDIPNIQQKGKNLDACIDAYLAANDGPRSELSYLAHQEFRLMNRGSEKDSSGWLGRFIGIAPTSELIATLNAWRDTFYTRNWTLEPAEERDEFYLRTGGGYLAPHDQHRLHLMTKERRIAFRFIPVEGKPAQFHLQCRRYVTGKNGPQYMWVVLDRQYLKLGDPADLKTRAAWKLEPAELGPGYSQDLTWEDFRVEEPVLRPPVDPAELEKGFENDMDDSESEYEEEEEEVDKD